MDRIKTSMPWATAADMLDVLKDDRDGRAFDELSGSIVSDMMKQIYDCAMLFGNMEGKASSVSSATYYGSEQETDVLDIA